MSGDVDVGDVDGRNKTETLLVWGIEIEALNLGFYYVLLIKYNQFNDFFTYELIKVYNKNLNFRLRNSYESISQWYSLGFVWIVWIKHKLKKVISNWKWYVLADEQFLLNKH